MKKLLLSLALVLVALTTNAQISPKYNGEIDFGYSVGVGDFAEGRVNLHTVQGAKLCDYFSAGLGLGLDYYHDGDELFIPIYLNMKGYYPVNSKLSPFVSLDLGYGIGATDDVSGCGGFYWAPQVGVRYDHFKFQFGYVCQRISEGGIGADLGAIQFKIGYVF